jgi:phosphoglycerate dehydrogenase-like enzyme
MGKLLPEVDFVFIAVPITGETRRMVGRAEIARMKPGGGIVNFGRAAALDHDALSSALASGQLSGAFLDVFDQEPLPEASPLWHTRNLIMTPHCTSDDLDAYMPATLDLFFENARRLVDGKPLKNKVDGAREY